MTFVANTLSAFALSLFFAGSALLAESAHKLAIHVDQNNPAVLNLVLNNVRNVQSYYACKGETVTI